MQAPHLPTGYTLRPANRKDARAIRALIHQTGINPFGIHWQRFFLIMHGQTLAACGQIKTHADGSRELASIAVHPHHRGQGLARVIILTLLQDETSELYLTCRAVLVPMYQKFGFSSVNKLNEMPPYFRRLFGFIRLIAGQNNGGPVLMRRQSHGMVSQASSRRA